MSSLNQPWNNWVFFFQNAILSSVIILFDYTRSAQCQLTIMVPSHHLYYIQISSFKTVKKLGIFFSKSNFILYQLDLQEQTSVKLQ